ncbi:unnamed protein product [Spirodela intermedia]|uniref:Uncharacterized protein n=1 Tax=Spirodela intermedia TaxID=51605 RepID=A0A7I8IDL5_SPIIN|nr:unnamed protein product [Spirodela intermedia]CAA6655711.1 unnamed protein product [Spirodela intermedia]
MDGGTGIFQSFMRRRSISSFFNRGGSGRMRSSEGETPLKDSSFLTIDLQQHFESEVPEHIQDSSSYARNLLEYCSYKALQEFRHLTYDMMLAWEVPGAENDSKSKENPFHGNLDNEDEDAGSLFYIDSISMAVQVDRRRTVGREAFCRIAPACPAIADTITVHNLFDALTSSSAGLLHFLLYDKYLGSLDKVFKAAKNALLLPLTSNLQLSDGEIVLDIDGNIPIQPVLQHIGITAWPGRLTLTSHALYFESLGVGSYDKAIAYDLAADSKQLVKPELIGPLGSRLFDKAVMYKSNSLEDPVYFEFPELKGHSRRDYWLAIIHEVLHVHEFIRKFDLSETQRVEALSKAILGIFQYRAVKEVFHIISSRSKTLLPFSLAENLPKGDKILEALHGHLELLCMGMECTARKTLPDATPLGNLLPVSMLELTRKGFTLMKTADGIEENVSQIGAFYVGDKSPLDKAVWQSICYSGKAETARATVEQVKVEGIDTNLAVMKGLLFPVIESYEKFHFLASWEDPFKSVVFLVFIIFSVFSKRIHNIPICVPITVKQETIREAISQLETLVQAGNIILLKLRAILLAAVPQTTDKVAIFLTGVGAVFILAYTREMPLRKHSSEKLIRRVREWWVRIPAAPVKLVPAEDPKKRN